MYEAEPFVSSRRLLPKGLERLWPSKHFSLSRRGVRPARSLLTTTLNFLTPQHIEFFIARVRRWCCIAARALQQRPASHAQLEALHSCALHQHTPCLWADASNIFHEVCKGPPHENAQLRSKREARYCPVTREEN